MTDTSQPATQNSNPRTLEAERGFSDELALWALCERRPCRKLGRCRAVPLTCIRECAPMVPAFAFDFLLLLDDCKQEGMSFEDALASLPEEYPGEFAVWHNAVARITGRPTGYSSARQKS